MIRHHRHALPPHGIHINDEKLIIRPLAGSDDGVELLPGLFLSGYSLCVMLEKLYFRVSFGLGCVKTFVIKIWCLHVKNNPSISLPAFTITLTFFLVPSSALCRGLQPASPTLRGSSGAGRSLWLRVAASGAFLWHHLSPAASYVWRLRPFTFHLTSSFTVSCTLWIFMWPWLS